MNGPGRRDAIQPRLDNVHRDHVRAQLARQGHGRLVVRRLAHDPEVLWSAKTPSAGDTLIRLLLHHTISQRRW